LKSNYVISILLLAIALTLTVTAVTIHSLNSQTANLLWGTSLGGLADIDRYIQWEWLVRICGLIAIPFYSSTLGLVYLEMQVTKSLSKKG